MRCRLVDSGAATDKAGPWKGAEGHTHHRRPQCMLVRGTPRSPMTRGITPRLGHTRIVTLLIAHEHHAAWRPHCAAQAVTCSACSALYRQLAPAKTFAVLRVHR